MVHFATSRSTVGFTPPHFSPRQLDEFPCISGGFARPGELAGSWVIAQVRGLFERRIAEGWGADGIGYYLPIRRENNSIVSWLLLYEFVN